MSDKPTRPFQDEDKWVPKKSPDFEGAQSKIQELLETKQRILDTELVTICDKHGIFYGDGLDMLNGVIPIESDDTPAEA